MLGDLRAGYFTHADFTRTTAPNVIDAGRIEEDHEVARSEAIRNFRGQLMQAQNFYVCVRELALERIGGTPRDAIITAQRIAISDDKNASHVACRSVARGRIRPGRPTRKPHGLR